MMPFLALLFCNICVSVVLQKVVRNQSHINPIAEELSQRLIVDGYVIKDKVDVIFLSRIIEGFSRNIASSDKVVSASVYVRVLYLPVIENNLKMQNAKGCI